VTNKKLLLSNLLAW